MTDVFSAVEPITEKRRRVIQGGVLCTRPSPPAAKTPGNIGQGGPAIKSELDRGWTRPKRGFLAALSVRDANSGPGRGSAGELPPPPHHREGRQGHREEQEAHHRARPRGGLGDAREVERRDAV